MHADFTVAQVWGKIESDFYLLTPFQHFFSFRWPLIPSAGSHVFALAAQGSSAGGTLFANAAYPVGMEIVERAAQNAANG